MDKKEMRKKFLLDRNMLTEDQVCIKSKAIIRKLMDSEWYGKSKSIMSYISFNHEVATKDLISHALEHEKRVLVPITDKVSKKLILSELKDFSIELQLGTYGILEPKPEFVRRVEDYRLLDLVIVPGLVFAQNGHRVGYGGGYYDKLLEVLDRRTISIGVAYAFQVVDKLPAEVFDQKVDYIITENGIIHCSTY